MNIPRSTLYYRMKHPKEPKYTEGEAEKVKEIFHAHNGSFGRRVLKEELKKAKMDLSERKISIIMKESGLKAKYGRRKGRNLHTHKETAERYIEENKYWNCLEEDRPKKAWGMDFTEQKVEGKTIYTCGIIAVKEKTLVGRITGEPNTARTACKALEKAIKAYGKPEMIMTDRGSPFTGKAFHELLEREGIEHSMSRAHTPRDNQYIETFWQTMKTEIGPVKEMTIAEYRMILEYYEYYYNNLRPHSALGYRPPLQAV